METLTAAQILAADDIKIEEVEIPEWGGKVYVRTLTGRERDAFEASTVSEEGVAVQLRNLRARFAAIVCCNEEGERLFPTDQAESALGSKSSVPLDRIWDAGRALNRMDEDSIEELAKNSESGQSEDSGSSSQDA